MNVVVLQFLTFVTGIPSYSISDITSFLKGMNKTIEAPRFELRSTWAYYIDVSDRRCRKASWGLGMQHQPVHYHLIMIKDYYDWENCKIMKARFSKVSEGWQGWDRPAVWSYGCFAIFESRNFPCHLPCFWKFPAFNGNIKSFRKRLVCCGRAFYWKSYRFFHHQNFFVVLSLTIAFSMWVDRISWKLKRYLPCICR